MRCLCGFVLIAAVCGVLCAEDGSNDDAEKLEGAWDLESVEITGKKIDATKGKGGSIVFAKDGKAMLKDPGKPDKPMKYRIDADKHPKQLDLIEWKDGKEGNVIPFLYECEDEQLKLAFSADGPKGQRPAEFKGERVGIMHFRRRKP